MRNIKLSIKLPALVVIAIAVTTVANGLVALAVSQAVFRPLVLQNNRDNAGAYASTLDQHLRAARVLLETVAAVSPLPGPATNPGDGVLSEAHALAAGVLENNSAFDYVVLLRADGSIATAQPAPFASEVETERMRSERALMLRAEDWFRAIISTGQTVVSDLHTSPVTQRPTVLVAAPMRDESGHVVALWVGGLNLGELHLLGKQATDDQSLPRYGYVVDSHGTLVAHQADEPPAHARTDLSVLPAMQQALAGRRGESEFTSPVAGEEELVTYVPLKEARWVAVWIVPEQVVFGQINRMALLMGSVSLLLAVLLGTLAVGVTRRVTRSLQQLTENARRIGAGDFTASDLGAPPAGTQGDELQILVGEFGRMADALQEKEAQLRQRAGQLEREVAERQRAEEALSRESQVNAAVAEVSRAIMVTPTAPIDDLAATILAHARRLTHSTLGFVAYLDPQTGRASCASIGAGRLDQDRGPVEQLMFEHLNNVRGWTLSQGQPLRVNDPTSDPCFMSMPHDHVPIRNFLSIPALIGGSLVGQIALANADHPYTDDDVNAVEPLASLYAVALQRQRAEDTLRASERKFRGLVEQSSDGIVMTDEHGIIIEWNHAQEQITGIAHAEAMGKPLWEAQSLGFMSGQKPPEIQEQSASSMRAFFDTGEAVWLNQLHEMELCLPGGDSRYIETVVFAIPGERGVMAGSITRDVTARKRMEQALRESEARYRAVVEDQTDLICRVKPSGELVFVNDAYCRYFDTSRSWLLGQTYLSLVPEPNREMVARHYDMLTVANPTSTHEVRMPLGPGNVRWLQWTNRAIFDDHGQVFEYQSVARDITDRKQAELELTYLSTHDALTGLYNRTYYERELERLREDEEMPVTMVAIDVNGMKRVNDRHGHLVGDGLLRRTAEVLHAAFGEHVMLARIGGDEFAVLLPRTDETARSAIKRRIRRALQAHNHEHHGTPLSFAIGLATANDPAQLVDVVRRADLRMYADKRRQRQQLAALNGPGSSELVSERLAHLKRLYMVLSRSSHAIVRARTLTDLYEQICRIAVEFGRFRMAWIGLVERGGDVITPVAHAGVTGAYLDRISLSTRDEPAGRGPSGTAIREQRYDVCNDIENDPRMEPWQLDAARIGYRSSGAFPLLVHGRAVGVLSLYAGEPGFFSAEEIDLLETLSANLSFAIESAGREQARHRSDRALQAREERFQHLAENAHDLIYHIALVPQLRFTYINQASLTILGYSPAEHYADPDLGWKMIHPDDRAYLEAQVLNSSPSALTLRCIRKDGSLVWLEHHNVPIYDEAGTLVAIEGIARDVTERKEAEALLRQSEERLRAVVENMPVMMCASVVPGEVVVWNRECERVTGYTAQEMVNTPVALARIYPDGVYGREVAKTWNERYGDYKDWETRVTCKDGRVKTIAWTSVARQYPIPGWNSWSIGVDVTERVHAYERLQQQVDHLAALRATDLEIAASTDLRKVLRSLLARLQAQLHVDAAAVLLLGDDPDWLTYYTGQGFSLPLGASARMPVNGSLSGRCVRERQVISILGALENPYPYPSQAFETHEVFRDGVNYAAYWAVPLLFDNQCKGVLEVFHREPLQPDSDWLDLLNAMAVQAALAIGRIELVNKLRLSNAESALAYEATLESWVRALELRDPGTHNHADRMVALTLQLAQRMGVNGEMLLHMYRGALLHDIGKMAVPDSILRKPGPLDEDEWRVMHQHPEYANKILAPIPSLWPALEIPYCHHERWDGTGYPRGLKGEQIPQAARIFAVVDVWDALCSDRPYRKAWPQAQARAYIEQQSGSHFDPRVVAAFLQMMDEASNKLV